MLADGHADDARPSTLGPAPSADQRAVSAEFGVNALGLGTLGQHLGVWPLGLGAAGRLVSADQRAVSPSEELRTAEAVMLKNMQAMQDGSTP
ncbi:MAG: hypothetical protein ABW234_01560 [Actinomycetes bacterium]